MNVGCRAIEAHDAVQGARVPIWLLYPAAATAAAAQAERFGAYTLEVARDAAVEHAGAPLPLVLVSHGTGGSPWVYRELAAYLARAGFVVALVEHTGNCRSDDSLAGTPANLANRPRHLHLAIDAALGDAIVGGALASASASAPRVGVIGHSMGGYTALAIAGGQPLALPNETPDGRAQPVAVEHDPRVAALVLLAPAAPWFLADGALAAVDVPILMFTGDRDTSTPAAHADIITRGLGAHARLEHRVVPNAGHFAYLTPFPAAMVSASFAPSQDPPGFDRAAFLPTLYAAIATFLRATIASSR